MSEISRGSIRIRGFENPEMDFQLIRQLAGTYARASSVGECLHIASQIQNGNPSDWVKAFEKQAQWQKEDGLARLKKNYVVSGREQVFKASNSFRAAEYYTSPVSEHHRKLGLNAADCFVTALGCMELHFESHSIPYKHIQLPTYFISPANDGLSRKTILIVSGFDGTLEESFFMNGLAAIERDYNVILFAGPGQMDLFRYYPDTFFEPDFEKVVTSVIDFYAFREEVAMGSLALLGNSVGGYFATRAAGYEPRIKALIANSPILDVHAYLASFTDMDPADIPSSEDFSIEDLPNIPDSDFPPELKARSEQIMIRFGMRSFKSAFSYMREFQVGEALANIQCPCLGLIGASEGAEPFKQFETFCKTTQASHHVFSNFEGASTHCQVGNLTFANAIIYDWLGSL